MKILIVVIVQISEAKDELEIKFRLADGSDIGPKCFPTTTSVAVLKESILAQWPKGWLDLEYGVLCVYNSAG